MSRTLKKHDRYWNGIAIYGDYLPWNVHKANGGDRTNWDLHSKRTLDLKDGKADGINYFVEMIEPELCDGIMIVAVPSHDPAKTSSGVRKLAARLAQKGNRVDGSQCLERTTKIAKQAHGGERGKDVHLKSVKVAQPNLIKGRTVLLIDDVTKTGGSLTACQELLLKAGARCVECATMSKT